ncbi:M20 family metallopeptidase [Bacillus sp. S/N-304-OC-R1]|uniref:M20 family metallopeptidase n=1 Tax=Bacillus sp. S/N-304-OC-R1 TaxID=2758034 RepID=UPI001C8E114C|nr:M20 family metallopeptidase [Bacillus sp. S/N-304-OC-R1]MBY0121839.1 amidohydrolase [Bacillus sp. S/N-304-OC-R1]
MNKFFELLDQAYDEMVEIRRYLHQNPELSFQEENTPKYIAEYHEKLGHEVRTGVGGRGVVATLRGGKPGQTVALRADFDALPIHEETDVPFKSKVDGVMHACGHDSHTATLLVLAKVLNSMKDEIEGNVVFIHQHAEEVLPGGAIAMIEDGCLDGVDVIFGQHIWSLNPVGTIEYRQGPVMAASDFFNVKIQGRGGHGSQPHKTKDSVVIGAQLVGNIQQIVSRRVDPLDSAVISIGSFEAKNAPNVIADSATLSGTVRTFKEETREFIIEEIERIIKGTCLTGNVDYVYNYQKGYPAVVNPQEEMEFVAEIAKGVPGVTSVEECVPHMGGEDFAYYLQKVKGAFFFTGGQNPEWKETYPHHHPKFDIDEKGMLIAAKTLGAATLTYLKNNN